MRHDTKKGNSGKARKQPANAKTAKALTPVTALQYAPRPDYTNQISAIEAWNRLTPLQQQIQCEQTRTIKHTYAFCVHDMNYPNPTYYSGATWYIFPNLIVERLTEQRTGKEILRPVTKATFRTC